ncbi:MFS transporter [Kitasatospora sp. NPDC008050]|uniref:MFS transporter n=1 Tax=Kitasatospora sp. NPDC008050 TaxID=3364021 RepID=UPI0036EFCF95
MMDPAARRKKLALGTLCITMFMSMLDNVIVNNALPRIGEELHTGVSGLQWVVEGYSLIYAGLLLTGGSLGDRYGRTRIFKIGLALFTLGSAAAALSNSIGLLIAARMLQGVGAALLAPGSLSILRQVFTDDTERAKAIGMWSAFSSLGLAVGPVLGGPMVQHLGWASVFWINVPIGVLGLVMASRVLPELSTWAKRVDVPGQALSAVGLGALVYTLVEGPSRGWTNGVVLGCAALAVVALAAFVVVELRTTDPMFDLHFFKDRVLTGAVVSGFMISFGVFGTSFFLPLLMQGIMGWTPSSAGLAGLPMTAMLIAAAPLSGRMTASKGPRIPIVLGLALCAVALGGLSLYDSHAHYVSYLWVLIVLGFGLGMSFTPVSIAVMMRVPPNKAGMASATVNMLRELGGVVGVAVLGAILTSRLNAVLAAPLGRLGVASGARHDIANAITNSGAGHTSSLPPAIHRVVNDGFIEALHLALRCGAAGLVVATLTVAYLLRPAPFPAAPPAAEPTQQDAPART